MTQAIIDADVIIKLSVLDLFWECLKSVSAENEDIATLESIRISCGLRNSHVRLKKTGDPDAAARLLMHLRALSSIDRLTRNEEATAAEIVAAAIAARLPVDAGEATLMSVAIHRDIPFVTTGDLRAIKSLQALVSRAPILTRLTGRVVCLEELLCRAIDAHPIEMILPRLAAGRLCDDWLKQAMTGEITAKSLLIAINERLILLRRAAPGFLVATQVHDALKRNGDMT